ncbi:MAG: transcription-repair coupling factor [Candidatus Eisenbacteria sp.]|nr:transcription-repair coupling factor [Candidatus Eisenbacteria bacterium]
MRWLSEEVPVGTALLEAIGRSENLQELVAHLESKPAGEPARAAGRHVGLLGLGASASTVAAAHLARHLASHRRGPLVYLVADSSTLEEAREDFIFLLGSKHVAPFPDSGVAPYDLQIPRARQRAARLETLARLIQRRAGEAADLQVVLTTPGALFQRIPRPEHLGRFVRTLRVGERVDMDDLLGFLGRLGYQPQSLVGEYGDMSRRGGIVDVYSFGRLNPVRIEFDDDDIRSLREFDVFTQRSKEILAQFTILPLWEVIVDDEDWTRAAQSGFLPTEGPQHEYLSMLRSDGSFEGIEWMMAGLGIPRGTLLDFTGEETWVIADDPLHLEGQLREAHEAVRVAASECVAGDPHPAAGDAGEEDEEEGGLASLFSAPEELFVMEGGLADLLASHPTVYMGIGARSTEEPREDAAREAPPRNRGWTAGEQLHPPDPLTVDPAEVPSADAWRKLITHSAGNQDSERRDAGQGDARQRDTGQWDAPDSDPETGERGKALDIDATLADAWRGAGGGWGDEREGSLLLPYATRYFTLRTQPQERFGRNLKLTRAYIERLHRSGIAVTVLCDTTHHRDRLAELMEGAHADFVVGNLAGGFTVPALKLAVLTDHEIFERLRRRRAGRRYSRGISLKELLAMRPGDFVVHIDHGIGVYRGIERLPVNSQLTDCMKIEYARGDKLFIPVDQLNLVQKYSAEEGHRPALSRLGTNQWAKTKARVKKAIKDMADELLRLYAVRKAQPGHAFPPDTVWQAEMEARFPYDETPDQFTAIQDVKGDMEHPVPMDRLICGDVGYGKTEVAIRAAFKVVMDGKQVAFLVPTTLLAQQHYDTITERLKGYPVRVEMLSRFRTRGELTAVLKDLAAGKVDIAVGTHRLIQKDVRFKDLGLLIVDEEQRFGVAHKERLKQLRTQIDVLTMTATPIPRTMNLALMGARDMSAIRTPPRDRRPIRTELVEFGDEVIRYALMREADRGGQSFFVHNRVESIDAVANYVRSLVPHLRIAVAHGQMRERKLEDVMRKFLQREYDVLVSTMIIESGLDMPNVNTILVNRTDTFGLAQLYQLRGRVGRSARLAYAYLLLPPHRVITEQAMKRLKAIEEFEDLGSGFQLAMRDLEIRGSGNILGTEQHGFVLNVGFDLYMRLLNEAMQEIKGQPIKEKPTALVITDLEAFIPSGYIADDPEKMNLYKSLADAAGVEKVDELAEEIIDRFGEMPPAAENLFELRRLRVRATAAGVETLTLRAGGVKMDMGRKLTRQDVQRLIREMPVPVVFTTHGRHRLEVDREEVRGAALLVARQILECLDKN